MRTYSKRKAIAMTMSKEAATNAVIDFMKKHTGEWWEGYELFQSTFPNLEWGGFGSKERYSILNSLIKRGLVKREGYPIRYCYGQVKYPYKVTIEKLVWVCGNPKCKNNGHHKLQSAAITCSEKPARSIKAKNVKRWTKEKVQKLLEAKESGTTMKTLAKENGVSIARINQLLGTARARRRVSLGKPM
jgi:hypothetical protein